MRSPTKAEREERQLLFKHYGMVPGEHIDPHTLPDIFWLMLMEEVMK